MPIRRTILCVILMLLVLLPVDQILACIPIKSPARDVFHEAHGVYLARFESDDLYEVIDAIRGPEAGLIRVPGVLKELEGCSAQPPPQEGEEYLVVTYCDPVAEATDEAPDAPKALHFSCRANAWPTAEYSDYVEFLERGEQVSRSDLIERLSEWELGRLSLADTTAWLADKELHADVMDWTDEGASLTGDLLRDLSVLFRGFALCSRQTVRAQKAFKARILPSVITLLGRGLMGPEDPAAADLGDEIDELYEKAWKLAERRGCHIP